MGPGSQTEPPRGARRGWKGGRTCAVSSGVPGPSRCQVAACSRAAAASPPVFASQTARCSGRSCTALWSYRENTAGLAFGTRILRHSTGVFARRSIFITTAPCRHRTGENGHCCLGCKCPVGAGLFSCVCWSLAADFSKGVAFGSLSRRPGAVQSVWLPPENAETHRCLFVPRGNESLV